MGYDIMVTWECLQFRDADIFAFLQQSCCGPCLLESHEVVG